MARDPMRTVQTVRERLVEQARCTLSECLKSEADRADRIRAIDAAAVQDLSADQAIANGYQFREMFVRRQIARIAERAAAVAELAVAEAQSAHARAAVTAARTAVEAVETFIAERTAAADIEAARRAQHVLDDMARARRIPGQRRG